MRIYLLNGTIYHTAILWQKEAIKWQWYFANLPNVSFKLNLQWHQCINLNFSQENEWISSKLDLEVKHSVWLHTSCTCTSITWIWVICHLLPFATAGQHSFAQFWAGTNYAAPANMLLSTDEYLWFTTWKAVCTKLKQDNAVHSVGAE